MGWQSTSFSSLPRVRRDGNHEIDPSYGPILCDRPWHNSDYRRSPISTSSATSLPRRFCIAVAFAAKLDAQARSLRLGIPTTFVSSWSSCGQNETVSRFPCGWFFALLLEKAIGGLVGRYGLRNLQRRRRSSTALRCTWTDAGSGGQYELPMRLLPLPAPRIIRPRDADTQCADAALLRLMPPSFVGKGARFDRVVNCTPIRGGGKGG